MEMSVDTQSYNRRKPLRTYKSPAGGGDEITIPLSTASSSSSSMRCRPTKPSKCLSRVQNDDNTRADSTRYQQPRFPALPLFHPLGKLAMSLPPLDPTLYGLPLLAVPDELEGRQGARHGTGKRNRGTGDGGVGVRQGVGAVAAREKASPRKRRTGGGGNRRRRRDGDDGDASYPAKRTRTQRGQNGEEESGIEGVEISGGISDGVMSELVEKHRSARNRGATTAATVAATATTTAVPAQRASSSSSEATTAGVQS